MDATNAHMPPADQSVPAKRSVSVRPLLLLPIGILLVEFALRQMPEGFMVRTVRARMEQIVTLPAPRLQVVGDSVSAGINAADLASAAGLPPGAVENYSLPGTSPVFLYYTLRRELAADRIPARILLAPHPANLETPMIDRFIGRFGAPGECWELLAHGVTLSDWLFGAACRVSIAMRDREEFRVAATEGDLGFFRTLRTPPYLIQATDVKISAPIPPPSKPPFNAATFPAQLSTPFNLDPVNANYLDMFCDLAGTHGIQVTWATVPVTRLFNERAMGGDGERKYQAFLAVLVQHHRNLTLAHPQIEVYPDDYFADPWHLNASGALRFSTALGAALKTKNFAAGASGM